MPSIHDEMDETVEEDHHWSGQLRDGKMFSLILISLHPSSSGANLSSMQCSEYISRGHHKSGLDSHRAVIDDQGRLAH
jgi:hypothetical protein